MPAGPHTYRRDPRTAAIRAILMMDPTYLVRDPDGGTAAVAGDAAQLARTVDALKHILEGEAHLRATMTTSFHAACFIAVLSSCQLLRPRGVTACTMSTHALHLPTHKRHVSS